MFSQNFLQIFFLAGYGGPEIVTNNEEKSAITGVWMGCNKNKYVFVTNY
jgi:hypothetical protein